jgi:DNA-binding NtrC family response regulator
MYSHGDRAVEKKDVDLLRLVIVEDNPDDHLLIRRALERQFPHCVITPVANAQEWEAVVGSPQVDVIITDYYLRWSTGLLILKQAKERRPQRPVIMFTATGSQEIAVEAMKAGLDDYVIKAPQHYVRLPVTVRAVLGRAAQKRALDKSRAELLEKLADLEEFQRSVVGRELKMMEMAKEIEYLRAELRHVKEVRGGREGSVTAQ